MKTIHHLVDVDAPVDTVWTALTRQDRMAGWWSTKVDAPDSQVGTLVRWTFAGDFNPVMEIIESSEPTSLSWRCASGHEPWQDSTFRFHVAPIDAGRTGCAFGSTTRSNWQMITTGRTTSTGAITSRAFGSFAAPATASRSGQPDHL